MTGPDYRIDGFAPASDRVADDFDVATLFDDMYTPLAAHHTADGQSFLLFYDRSAIWDNVPGTAEYVGMHFERDLDERTFCFDVTRQPTVPLAQNWLITRGCPPEEIEPDAAFGPRPADALTTRLEDRLRTNPNSRYTLLDHYTHNPGRFDEGAEVRVIVHDAHPDAADRPYRLFLEETTPSFAAYTVREGAFSTAEDADTWVQERNGPLPLAPQGDLARRAAAARSRTTASATPGPATAAPGPAPAAAPGAARSRGGRS
ncbi:hypothetical protein [Streptomyces smyrnaeus]|uniref:hypothetical protein n=1 Tax=Streptomyces smyrnaeus TaxID=1387713 RepID=UPI0036CA7753